MWPEAKLSVATQKWTMLSNHIFTILWGTTKTVALSDNNNAFRPMRLTLVDGGPLIKKNHARGLFKFQIRSLIETSICVCSTTGCNELLTVQNDGTTFVNFKLGKVGIIYQIKIDYVIFKPMSQTLTVVTSYSQTIKILKNLQHLKWKIQLCKTSIAK